MLSAVALRPARAPAHLVKPQELAEFDAPLLVGAADRIFPGRVAGAALRLTHDALSAVL